MSYLQHNKASEARLKVTLLEKESGYKRTVMQHFNLSMSTIMQIHFYSISGLPSTLGQYFRPIRTERFQKHSVIVLIRKTMLLKNTGLRYIQTACSNLWICCLGLLVLCILNQQQQDETSPLRLLAISDPAQLAKYATGCCYPPSLISPCRQIREECNLK